MTPDQITQLRQLLKYVKKILRYEYSNTRYDANFSGLDQALALLPCPICNGTGKVPNGVFISCLGDLTVGPGESCPDCK